jgi:hypothetical protein
MSPTRPEEVLASNKLLLDIVAQQLDTIAQQQRELAAVQKLRDEWCNAYTGVRNELPAKAASP